ncbi:UNVERIFIED_CONTAM: hypothetical protein FKN15_050588 [Acipenser sinensis]
MDRNALAELLQALESRRDAEERRREERYTALIERVGLAVAAATTPTTTPIYPIKDVPVETEPLTNWLYQRFVEKEELLAHFYETGLYPNFFWSFFASVVMLQEHHKSQIMGSP